MQRGATLKRKPKLRIEPFGFSQRAFGKFAIGAIPPGARLFTEEQWKKIAGRADPFATQEQRKAAIKRARANLGTVAKLAAEIRVDYSDLWKWVRDRGKPSLAKGTSARVQQIEEYLHCYSS